MSIEEDTWKFLRGKNLPEKSVAAAMGNIQAESEFDTTLIEKGSGVGLGLCQWSYERRSQLETYGTDLTHQLNFLWAELSGQIGSTGASFQWINKSGYLSHDEFMSGNGSIADLTKAMCFCWERPNASVAHLERRQQKAQEYYAQFTGTQGTASSQTEGVTIPTTNYQVVKGSQKEGQILFGRRYRITVSDDSGNSIDVSNLKCEFNIVKTIQAEPNSSTVTIYNLNAETENWIEINAMRVAVEAGYEGTQFGLIFDGDILQTIRDKSDGATYRLSIIALDSDRAVNYELANFSVLRGQTARTIVDHIVNKAQYPVSLGSISEGLNTAGTLTRGKVFFGKASDYLQQIADSNKCQYYTEDGKVNLVKLTEMPENEIFDLSPSSGLIGTPEQSDYGITGQCLLNPRIKVNTLIHVDNSLVRAKQISLTGSSNTVPSVDNTSAGSVSGVRQKIIAEAKKLCDDPNVGYSQPLRGQTVNGKTYYDCSLFTKHCYNNANISLDDITNPQWAQVQPSKGGKVISQSEAKAGDIVFWFNGSDCHHVAIYDGNGGLYAARTSQAPFTEQVEHQSLYGSPKFGRPKGLVEADSGNAPSANSTNNTDSSTSDSGTTQTPTYRSLDKDGIYRIIKVTYEGSTRGDNWYCDFETITQAGGTIPIVTS
jgi:hypothetical protein